MCVKLDYIMTPSNHPYFEGEYPLVMPHRGGLDVVPENTLEALDYCYKNKFTHFETDLRKSKDNVIFLHHDATLERTTNFKGKVKDYSWKDLLKINAGHQFYDRKKKKQKRTDFISLEDALSKFSDMKFNLDIKEEGMSKKILEIVLDCKASERILVSSFSPKRLRQFQILNKYNIATSGSIKENIQAIFNSKLFNLWALKVEALQIPIKWKGVNVLTKRLVDYAHSKNMEVHVWTINDSKSLKDCLLLGCDGIMTDRPVEMRELVREIYG